MVNSGAIDVFGEACQEMPGRSSAQENRGGMHKFSNPILIFGYAVESSREAEDIDLLVVGEFDKKASNMLKNG